MRGDGVGLMMKGFQRPSLEAERAHEAPSYPGGPYPHTQQYPSWCPSLLGCRPPGGPGRRDAIWI